MISLTKTKRVTRELKIVVIIVDKIVFVCYLKLFHSSFIIYELRAVMHKHCKKRKQKTF